MKGTESQFGILKKPQKDKKTAWSDFIVFTHGNMRTHEPAGHPATRIALRERPARRRKEVIIQATLPRTGNRHTQQDSTQRSGNVHLTRTFPLTHWNEIVAHRLRQQRIDQPASSPTHTTENRNTNSLLHHWEQAKKAQKQQEKEAAEKKKQAELTAKQKKEREAAMKGKKEAANADPKVWQALARELQEQEFDKVAQALKQSWQGKTQVSVSETHEQKATVVHKPVKPTEGDDTTPISSDKLVQERSKAGMKLSYSYEVVDSKTQASKTITQEISFGIGWFVTFEGESWEAPDNDFWGKKEQNVKAYYIKTPNGVTRTIPVDHPQALQTLHQFLTIVEKNFSPDKVLPKPKSSEKGKDVKKKPTFGAWHWISNRGLLEYLFNKEFYDHAS